MFVLKLFDSKGKELRMGDIVRVSDGKRFSFWCQVTYLAEEKVIAPFHTFSFHSFEKVDAVPDYAIKSSEERYNIWYAYDDNAEEDKDSQAAEGYLMSWRQCEHLLEKRCFRIELQTEKLTA